tara:strand:+ start:28 stop:189 length:162 start_codon:yes stop_codon:yes gene_type:complete
VARRGGDGVNLELMVGVTLILVILEFGFWGFIVWGLLKKQADMLRRVVERKKQ